MSSLSVPTTFLSTDAQTATVEGSLLFDHGKYLHRSQSTSGNRKQWTFSVWVKKAYQTDVTPTILSSDLASFYDYLIFYDDSSINKYMIHKKAYDSNTSTSYSVLTSSLYRDYGSWYHIVWVRDTTQADANDREQLYINGVKVTSYGTNSPFAQNADGFINAYSILTIGNTRVYSSSDNFVGCMAHIHFVDGGVLSPTDFGHSVNGIWLPKEYTGSYGTQGFCLKFEDPSDLGKDTSGNGNDFTVTGFTSSDLVKDTPTNNYPVLNPLTNNSYAVGSLSAGNLTAKTDDSSTTVMEYSTMPFPSSGKWYYEAKFAYGSSGTNVGIGISSTQGATNYNNAYQRVYRDDGKFFDGSVWATYSGSYSVNDTIGVAFDADNGDLTFYKNGVSQGTAASGISFDSCIATTWQQGGNYGWDVNFGQYDWTYDPPDGYVALCANNIASDYQPVKQETQVVTGDNFSFFDHEIIGSCFGNGGATNNFRMYRTPTTTGNRKTWTFSAWARQVDYGTAEKTCIFSTGTGTGDNFLFHLSDTTSWNWYIHDETGGSKALKVEPITGFETPWDWHHYVLQVDTTQATAKDRVVLWIDGVKYNEKYALLNVQPSQNLDTRVNNSGEPFYLFYNVNNNVYCYMYLADVYFLDGSSQPATTFGEFKDGFWRPKNPGGLSYGTNGFHLNFGDPDDIGKDISGKGNDFTVQNYSTNYRTKDSPTNTLSVLDYYQSDYNNITEGGISFSRSADNRGWSSTMPVTSGKWYCEITLSAVGDALVGIGHLGYEWNTELGLKDGEIGWYQPDGTLRINNTTGNLYGYSFNGNEVLGIALDMDNNRVYFSLNGVWQRGGTPETLGLPAATGLPSPCQIIVSTHGTGQVTGTINYGQYDFKHRPPSVFLPLGDYYDYNIGKSIRVTGSSSEGYLAKTFSSSGNRKTWTFSTWFKYASSSAGTKLFGTPIVLNTSGTDITLYSTFGSIAFNFTESSTSYNIQTVAEYRDARWHHLVVQLDTTNATSSDRIKFYVDGKRVEDFTATPTYPSQNTNLDINLSTLTHQIGSATLTNGVQLSETIFVDGHVVDPIFFGKFKDNMWVPIDYDTNYGLYGSNGFYLDYSNNSNLGNDVSGNNNNFTVTAGSVKGLTDSPTSHFCVLERESFYNNGSSSKDLGTIQHNGLSWQNTSSSNFNGCYGTHGIFAGKLYWEVFTKDGDATNKGNWMAGVADAANLYHYVARRSDGAVATFTEESNSATWSGIGASIGNSDTLCVAYDADSNKLWFGKNGTWFNSGNPATGANPSRTVGYAGCRPFVGDLGSSGSSYVGINFGQDSFNYTPPTGFKSVSYKNMDRPANYGDYTGTTPYCLDGSKSDPDILVYNDSKTISTVSGSAWKTILANQPLPTNGTYKYTDDLYYYYWEVTVTGTGYVTIGIADSSVNLNNYLGSDEHGWSYYSGNGNTYHNATSSTYGNSYTADDVIGVAVGMDSSGNVSKLLFRKNGTWQNSATPAYTNISGTLYPAFSVYDSDSNLEVNFGEKGFSCDMLVGKPLNAILGSDARDFHPMSAKYLPETTAGYDYGFDLELYTGNSRGETKTSVPVNFKPDLIWIKNRSAGDSNVLLDSVRGWQREFRPDVDYESGVTEFHEALDSHGVQNVKSNIVIVGSRQARYNTNGENHVVWYWKSDPDWGIEVIEYLGDGTTPRQISHNLGKVPEFWFVRNRQRNDAYWYTYHKNLNSTIPQNKYLRLNSDGAVGDSTALWADTAPTSTYITVGSHASVNRSGNAHVLYLFTGIDGFSKFGTYTGNLNANGPFIYTGFRPAFIITKGISGSKDWRTFDVKRLGYNCKNYLLRAAVAAAEASENSVEIYSNGFKLTSTDGNSNGSAVTFMYAAFAEQPMKYANAR